MALTIERTRFPRPNGYRATLGPLEVTRPTKTEAREAIIRQAEGALSGSFQPAFLVYGGRCVLIYRDAHGWSYVLSDGDRPNFLHGVTIQSGDDRAAVITSARKHLAQAAWPDLNGLDLLAGDHAAILDHLHWIGFQRAYDDYVNTHDDADDNSAHRFVCNTADEDRWLQTDELAARDAARAAVQASTRGG